MYLKEIRAQGFKSFADKTIIKLDQNITGIVGPNGSGKSNVVDAVRWVLGEQSVKELRGDNSMTDVSFAGSTSRSPLNVASVTLVFDNSDKYLPMDYAEVAVKRRVYIDGTNEFYLNEEKVRLKDIQNLFLDSGIGKDSFNIISQGKIEEILSDKPTDRRIVFEEAAGVLKYKKRKEEALKKLEIQVDPLKEAKEKTLKYNEVNSELESIEVSLITNDITTINYSYQESMNKVETLKNEILSLTSTNSNNEAIIEKYKLNISELDNQIRNTSNDLINVTSEVEKLNSRKAIILEREKYKVEDSKLHENIVNLKETSLKLEKNIKSLELDIIDFTNKLDDANNKLNTQNSVTTKLKISKEDLDKKILELNKEEIKLKNIISSLEEAIDNNSNIPYAVKNVLNNPKLRGIHDVIGSLIDVPNNYSTAISVAIGSSSSFIVVDNEESAKEAINYLKNNNIGRATFFPLNIIKSKEIDEATSNILKTMKGYINDAGSLVSYDPKYKGIILNQLGNIIVVDNIDNANIIAKKIQNRYRIVTLDGELINIGGSITGGKIKVRNIINDTYELDKAKKDLESLINNIKNIEENINSISNDIKNSEDKAYLINKDKIEIDTYLNNKVIEKQELSKQLVDATNEINGTNNIINNSLSDEENKIMLYNIHPLSYFLHLIMNYLLYY